MHPLLVAVEALAVIGALETGQVDARVRGRHRVAGLARRDLRRGRLGQVALCGLWGLPAALASYLVFQYGAEVSYPAPEATSQGLMVWAGQVSGILFILGMDAFRAGPEAPMTGSMVAFIVMTAVVIVMALFLRESAMIRREAAQDRPGPSSADRP